MLEMMKRAGINWVCYGFESADPMVAGNVGKRFELAKMEEVIRWTREARINILANFMFGLPEDSMETMQKTLDWAKSCLFEYVNFYVAMAYPGSKLYEDAIKNGTSLPETWDAYGQYSPNAKPLPTKYLTPQEVLGFRDRAFMEYFLNPAYTNKITNKWGRQAADHIGRLLQWRLERHTTGLNIPKLISHT